MPKVSVIVPIYNTAEYLDECLKSLALQTMQNIEVIMVDDGSTDDSAAICKKYLGDSRFSYYHQENQGLSAARNVGIDRATGDYVSFIDSDDYIDDCTYEHCFAIAKDCSADVIIFGWEKIIDGRVEASHFTDEYRVYNACSAIDRLLSYRSFDNFACNKIFRTSIVKRCKFIPNTLLEDVRFTYKALGCACKISVFSEPLYKYRMRDTSLTSLLYKEIDHSTFKAYSIRRRELLAQFPEIRNRIESNYFTAARHFYLGTIKSIASEKMYEKKYSKVMRSRIQYVFRDDSISLKVKLGCLITAFFPVLYKLRNYLNGHKN